MTSHIGEKRESELQFQQLSSQIEKGGGRANKAEQTEKEDRGHSGQRQEAVSSHSERSLGGGGGGVIARTTSWMKSELGLERSYPGEQAL